MWRLINSKWINIIFWIAIAIDVYLIYSEVNKSGGAPVTIVVGILYIGVKLWYKYGENWWYELQEQRKRR